jgi:hypothetical protein
MCVPEETSEECVFRKKQARNVCSGKSCCKNWGGQCSKFAYQRSQMAKYFPLTDDAETRAPAAACSALPVCHSDMLPSTLMLFTVECLQHRYRTYFRRNNPKLYISRDSFQHAASISQSSNFQLLRNSERKLRIISSFSSSYA